MSTTYVGPFGRILPLPSLEESGFRSLSPSSSNAKMVSHALPLLPIPANLNFGSDSKILGFSDPTRYENGNQPHRSHHGGRDDVREKLPPVSQLLTPGSLPGVVSPFNFPQHSTSGPPADSRPVTSTSQNNVAHGLQYTRQENGYFPAAYDNSRTVHPQYSFHGRHALHTEPSPLQYQHYQQAQSFSNDTAYRNSPSLHSRNTDLPRGASMASQQWYPQHNSHGSSTASPHSTSAPSTSDHHAGNVKPLPKFIREENIPGEGVCYIYEDGSRVKKVIDGEIVNAHWGITKAGKPRKRLAVACMTCREKKIKCDPNEPKCLQCDKSGRECRFQSAVRGQHNSPNSISYEQQARTPSSMTAPTESHFDSMPSPYTDHAEAARSNSHVVHKSKSALPGTSKRRRDSDQLVSTSQLSSKRRRLSNGESETHHHHQSQDAKFGDTPAENGDLPLTPSEDMSDMESPPEFSEQDDPCLIDHDLALQYIDLYFLNVNAASCRLFPPDTFKHWMRTAKNKSSTELMVVYAMLAVASVFSTRQHSKSEGKVFAGIAETAVERRHGRPNLQLVQSRVLLALYHSALGDQTKAWGYCASAASTTTCLQLDLDEAVTDRGDDGALFCFGLNRHGLAECHRRTYWSVFLMDRYIGYRVNCPPVLQKENVFVKLPCCDDLYESQIGSQTPFFDNGIVDKVLTSGDPVSEPSIMACEVNICTIWSDVTSHATRWRHAAPQSYLAEYDGFYEDIRHRLEAWISALPSTLQFSKANIHASIEQGNLGSFMTIHSLCHLTIMILNRQIRHPHLQASFINRNIQTAVKHARLLLTNMGKILEITEPSTDTTSDISPRALLPLLSTPVLSFAILYAIDILSAAGTVDSFVFADTLCLINSGLAIVERLSSVWAVAAEQSKAIRTRVEHLTLLLHDTEHSVRVWTFEKAMDRTVPPGEDVFYLQNTPATASAMRIMEALGTPVLESEIVVVNDGVE